MPQSFVQLYAHLVFSTKNREPLLDESIRPRVHAYIAEIVRDMDVSYVVVGGVADHVHILFEMGKLHKPFDFPERIKTESSKFIKTLGPQYRQFYWQRSYGLFSVSPTHREEVETYVQHQAAHHQKISFQEESLGFLKRYDVAYDERYIWD